MANRRTILGALAASLLFAPTLGLAQADYSYRVIDYPGTPSTNLFGISDPGVVVGIGVDVVGSYPFLYDIKKGTFTDLATVTGYDNTGFLGISDSGRLVGNVYDSTADTLSGLIRDVRGIDTVFLHPSAVARTEVRGVNNKGLVSGSRDSAEDPLNRYAVAFVHDPKAGTFTDFAPSLQTITHGMNSRGDVVGNVTFISDLGPADPCPDLPGDFGLRSYGWRRTADGTLTFFTVNAVRTAARGINDKGQISGFIFTDEGQSSFVIDGKDLGGASCIDISVAAEDLLRVPGFMGTLSEGITNSGTVVGVVIGADGVSHGFVATPK